MVKRRGRGGLPLEWLGVVKTVAAASPAVNEVVVWNPDLDDDEVAEIVMIDSDIKIVPPYPISVDMEIDASVAVTMDSGYTTTVDPYSEAGYEDLEVIFTHRYSVLVDMTTAGSHTVVRSDNKIMKIEPGILIAANVGILLECDEARDITYAIRLYFKRRKASDVEIARTLLKRR